jgi:alkylated DNA repair dioxygenase AlkB
MNQLEDILFYYPDFIEKADQAMYSLKKKINWRSDDITIFGKTYPIPRMHAWYGDPGAHYSYSGIPMPINEWFGELLFIKEKVEMKTGLKFNGVLANLYRDGSDSNGWHADDEKELVKPIHVASITLGAERAFQLRRKGESKIAKSLTLENGSLLVMKAPCQKYWQHQIPKRARVSEERINLTFRLVREG